MQLIQQICQYDSSLPALPKMVKMNYSGLRMHASLLPKDSILIDSNIHQVEMSQSLVLQVTASHNPHYDNGIKIGYGGEQSLDVEQYTRIEQFINIQQPLSLKHFPQPNHTTTLKVLLGRDKRQSSQHLFSILKFGLERYSHLKLMDLGEVTTPQLFAIAFKLQQGCYQFNSPSTIKSLFASQMITHFQRAAYLLYICPSKKIYLDFGNGVGAISYQSYSSILENYFNITIVNNKQFSKTNLNCGSEYISSLKQLPPMGDFDQKYYFDGDCDRIIMQLDANDYINGDGINCLFAVALCKMMSQMGLEITLGVVSDINVNMGLVEFLNNLKVKHSKVKVKKYDVGCYFEVSGHGSIYMKKHVVKYVRSINNKTIHHQLFLILYQLSCNSCKGYAFHNFLIIQICMYYLGLIGEEVYLYKKIYEINQDVIVADLSKFKTNPQDTSLQQPDFIVSQINSMKLQYPQCYITIRMSQTESKIRIKVQGNQQRAKYIIKNLKELVNRI